MPSVFLRFLDDSSSSPSCRIVITATFDLVGLGLGDGCSGVNCAGGTRDSSCLAEGTKEREENK